MSTAFNPNQPATARIWNYLLGGKDNFAVDRHAAENLLNTFPVLWHASREDYAFLLRAVGYLAAEAGIRQFLDIGTGLPSSPAVHEVARGIDRSARVVHVDHDAIVGVHAQSQLTGDYLDADLRDVDALLAALRQSVLDLTEPVGLLLTAVLHEIPDEQDPHRIVRQLIAALPSGSHVVLSHPTADLTDRYLLAGLAAGYGWGPFQARSRDELTRLLDGLEVVDPGLVIPSRWRPKLQPSPCGHCGPGHAISYAAVGRRP
ncbi:SAM-dependent methyltransferase [Actinoplanes aureus]|uniref:SAM-dependent methyltransferase n=1 Tax=Actinoplanes aureus TaxID=2792083 RepID=A0A931CNJ8_9ACTN|nr:SAM-dependent methyltransferase [Actinoplanes aureus]MBG0568165.1 SAM-dependent methyltransferase [Actinoplanes aureus]